MLAKKTPHFFTYGNHPIAKLPDYLDSMIRKIVKETSFQDSESAKQLLASMEVKPVAAASLTSTSTEESKGEETCKRMPLTLLGGPGLSISLSLDQIALDQTSP